MRPSYVQTVQPAELPVSVAEVMLAARVDADEEKARIESLIRAATEWIQAKQWSQLVTSTWVARMKRFPCDDIELNPNPVQSVTVSYVNTSGATVALVSGTDFVLDSYAQPAVIRAAYGVSWPTTRGFANDVTITAVCGYGGAYQVPESIKNAIKLIVAHWYDGCADAGSIPMAAEALLNVRSYAGFV